MDLLSKPSHPTSSLSHPAKHPQGPPALNNPALRLLHACDTLRCNYYVPATLHCDYYMSAMPATPCTAIIYYMLATPLRFVHCEPMFIQWAKNTSSQMSPKDPFLTEVKAAALHSCHHGKRWLTINKTPRITKRLTTLPRDVCNPRTIIMPSSPSWLSSPSCLSSSPSCQSPCLSSASSLVAPQAPQAQWWLSCPSVP